LCLLTSPKPPPINHTTTRPAAIEPIHPPPSSRIILIIEIALTDPRHKFGALRPHLSNKSSPRRIVGRDTRKRQPARYVPHLLTLPIPQYQIKPPKVPHSSKSLCAATAAAAFFHMSLPTPHSHPRPARATIQGQVAVAPFPRDLK
jgi:hypothetical protein